MKGKIYILLNALIISTLLWGCSPSSPTDDLSNTPIAIAIPSATLIPTFPTFTPVITPSSKPVWATFTHPKLNFSIDYPTQFEFLVDTAEFASGSIGNNIFFFVSEYNPVDCRGDCPMIDKKEDVLIGQVKGVKLIGYYGAVGGIIPQEYITYIFPKGELFIIFTITALGKNHPPASDDTVQLLSPEDISLFEQIMLTIKYLK